MVDAAASGSPNRPSVPVGNSGLHRLLRQDGTVDLYRRQAVQGLHHRLIGKLQRLAEGLAFNHIGSNGAGCNRGGAAEGLELDVLNDLIVTDLQIHPHNIAAFGVADLANAVGVVKDADVVGVSKVLHYFFAVFHSHGSFSFLYWDGCFSAALRAARVLICGPAGRDRFSSFRKLRAPAPGRRPTFAARQK